MRPKSSESLERASILMLATTVPAHANDGTPSFVLDLACELAEEAEVTILAPRVSGAPTVEDVSGVTVHRFPYFPSRWEGLADDAIMPTLKSHPWRWVEVPPLVLSMAWHTWRITGRGRFDVINAHWIIPAGLVARAISSLRHLPYVVTVHGADAYTLNGGLARLIKGDVLRHARVTLPVSGDTAAVVRSIAGDGANIGTPVPMGVRRLDPMNQERSQDTFLFVGRLAQKKGLDIALRSLNRSTKCHLRVIGDGPERARLESLVTTLHIEDRVTFLGRRPRSDVIAEMRRCAALLIPSVVAPDGDKDGTPVVLAEAMSCGTPVIATGIVGLADYVRDGETGLLVEPGNIDELSETMNRVVSDPANLAAMGKRAAEWFPGSPLDIRETATDYLTQLTSVQT